MEKQEIIYQEIKHDGGSGENQVALRIGSQHLGSIWGTVKKGTSSFDKKHRVIYISRKSRTVATIWNAKAGKHSG